MNLTSIPVRRPLHRLALAAALLVAGAASAQPSRAFGPGEQTTYKVQYLGVTAGTATVTVGAPTTQWGKSVWPIVSVAKSDPDVGVWPIRDKFVTYWEASSGRVLGSDFFADENKKRRRQRIKMDEDLKGATVIRQKEGQPPREARHELPEGTSDVAGATFRLRSEDLAVGREYAYPVFTGTKSFTLRAKVEGQQKLQTALGARDVYRVRVKTQFGGKLESKRDMTVFITTDPSHVVLRLEADFAVGALVADIVEYKAGRAVASTGTPSPRG